MRLSKYASLIQPSATMAAAAKARQLRANGVMVHDFSLGEPDQNTPRHICSAAEKAMRDGHTHYTPANGLTEVRTAVAEWYKRQYGWDVTPERVVMSNGAKHAIHNGLVATVGPGDEVIVPTPYWTSYSDLIAMAGATPVLVPTTYESGFKLTPAKYRAARTPRTRMILMNSPCNPTGTVYTRQELSALVDAICETDVSIMSDEIYEQLCYGDAKPTCLATLRPDLPDRTIVISGASKSYAMTGWRIAWGIAPPAIAKAMADIQSQETGCPSSIAQHGVIEALTGPQECVVAMRAEYLKRRNLVCSRLKSIPGVEMRDPDGAFYAFFNVTGCYQRLGVNSSEAFCAAALETAHVNLVPGSAFGCEGFVRMSYASSTTNLEAGLAALAKWLA